MVHGNKAISTSIFLVVSSLVKACVYREFVVRLLELVHISLQIDFKINYHLSLKIFL